MKNNKSGFHLDIDEINEITNRENYSFPEEEQAVGGNDVIDCKAYMPGGKRNKNKLPGFTNNQLARGDKFSVNLFFNNNSLADFTHRYDENSVNRTIICYLHSLRSTQKIQLETNFSSWEN